MNKTALVFGIGNRRSIAMECVRSLLYINNYDVIMTYQNERYEKSVNELMAKENLQLQKHFGRNGENANTYDNNQLTKIPSLYAIQCDVQTDLPILFREKIRDLLQDISNEQLRTETGRGVLNLDHIVHSLAFAPSEAMKGDGASLLSTSLDAFITANSISAYSLIEITREALPLLSKTALDSCENSSSSERGSSSSITTLSYIGSSRAIPNYNVMGPVKASLESIVRGLSLELGSYCNTQNLEEIRINAVSSGPIRTLSSRGISDFDSMVENVKNRAPLQRNITSKEVANTVAFLASNNASGITGQTIFVDGGYSIV